MNTTKSTTNISNNMTKAVMMVTPKSRKNKPVPTELHDEVIGCFLTKVETEVNLVKKHNDVVNDKLEK
jgi:hypothetical protein